MNKAAKYSTGAERPRRGESGGSFLPDFCRQESLLPVMLIAELLAVILAAAQTGADWEKRLTDFALMSLFIQWVALCDVAVLCALRGPLAHLSNRGATALGFVLLQLVTLAITLAMGLIVEVTGLALILPQDWFGIHLQQNLIISAVVTAVALRYFHVQHELRRRLAAEAEARVQALQARIRPHFLFNSMNTIASLTRIDAATAEAAVQDLSELFRASLAERDRLSLAEEVELTRSYLRMEQLRLGERLRVEWDIRSSDLSPGLPALSLQPLVENAVYHGVEPMADGGTIHLSIVDSGADVLVTIDNPVDASAARRQGNRIAQENVRQRLALAFGSDDRLRVDFDHQRYRVELRIPRAQP